MIRGKINVSKIDKAKLFKGEKGTYLDICLIDTPNSEYGDYMIVQDATKEERAAGKKGAILGNAKLISPRVLPKAPPEAPDVTTADDDVPF